MSPCRARPVAAWVASNTSSDASSGRRADATAGSGSHPASWAMARWRSGALVPPRFVDQLVPALIRLQRTGDPGRVRGNLVGDIGRDVEAERAALDEPRFVQLLGDVAQGRPRVVHRRCHQPPADGCECLLRPANVGVRALRGQRGLGERRWQPDHLALGVDHRHAALEGRLRHRGHDLLHPAPRNAHEDVGTGYVELERGRDGRPGAHLPIPAAKRGDERIERRVVPAAEPEPTLETLDLRRCLVKGHGAVNGQDEQVVGHRASIVQVVRQRREAPGELLPDTAIGHAVPCREPGRPWLPATKERR